MILQTIFGFRVATRGFQQIAKSGCFRPNPNAEEANAE
jgi:hypothetical protein